MSHQLIMVIDFGGQYNHLIARRVRDCLVYCEVFPYTVSIETIKERNPIGIIFTGGPNSAFAPNAPLVDSRIYSLGIPVLGICYGMQMIAQQLGGHVATPDNREYGKEKLSITDETPLFTDVPKELTVWMSHTDYVDKIPEGFKVSSKTEKCPAGSMENLDKKIFGLQFHPEVTHTECGNDIIKNFLFKVCGAVGDWSMRDYVGTAIKNIQDTVGNGKVLLALSGGVDSSVCAALLEKAIGSQLTCIFVDHGLMRLNEGDEVVEAFKNTNLKLIRINAEDRFLNCLKGVTDPETKRKIIGKEFIRVFEEEGKKIGSVDFLAQGTIYPDVVESGTGEGRVIKSHHNVGGLPAVVDFKGLVEPLRMLFKDEVRALGKELNLPDYLVWRQP
ncbi:MAG: glutamine-hydrolyzing GMP synthase, partial [Oscillospiraceae bacterium]